MTLCGDRFHYRERMGEQRSSTDQMRCGVADQAAAVPGFREMGVDDFREEAIGPIGVHAIARRVEFLHFAPQSPAVLEDGNLEPCDALVRNVDDVLRIMQERCRVVIAPKKEDLPIELDESDRKSVV